MSIERLSRSALHWFLGVAVLCAAGSVEDGVVGSLNDLYKNSISEATDSYYQLQSTLMIKETATPGTSQLVLLLRCALDQLLSLHYFRVAQDGDVLSIKEHNAAETVEPDDKELYTLDQFIYNQTNITVSDGRTILGTEKQLLSVSVSSSESPLNFTLLSRAFYNDTMVIYAAAAGAPNTTWAMYISTRNATKLDQLASSSLPEPFFYLVFAAFVGMILTYASAAYYWQRNNTLPFLKRREDQHFPFDMGTGRSQ